MNSASHINLIYVAFGIQDIQTSPILCPLLPIPAAIPGASLLPFVPAPFILCSLNRLRRRHSPYSCYMGFGRRHAEHTTEAVSDVAIQFILRIK